MVSYYDTLNSFDMGIKSEGITEALDALNGMASYALSFAEEAIKIACMNVVRDARLTGNYTDRTGNLRSSVGFMIKNGGNIVGESFRGAGTGSTSGGDGVKKARELADRVSSMYGDQLVAVIVAGMEYAIYVESKGFDVISGSMINFTKYFNEYFAAAGGDVSQIRVKKGVGNK